MIGQDRTKRGSAAILFPEFLNEEPLDGPRLVMGHVYDDQQIWHLRDLIDVGDAAKAPTDNESDEVIGIYLPDRTAADIAPGATAEETYDLEQYPLFLNHTHVVCSRDGDSLVCHIRRPQESAEAAEPEQLNVEEVDLDRLFVRVQSDETTPLETLQNKKVAVVGLGSGGGLIATYLAKSGVKEMVFIDDDLFETHNIVRHVCGEEALGREKVRAVRDYIHRRVPDVEINPIIEKFSFQPNSKRPSVDTENLKEQFRTEFEDADIIVSAAAEPDVNRQLNRFVHEEDIDAPVVYAGLFSNLKGGIIIRVDRSKNDPCYHCIYRKLEAGGRDSAQRHTAEEDRRAQPETHPEGVTITRENPRPQSPEAEIHYDRNLEDEQSEPGLGLDVDNLSIFVTKVILSNLLEGTDHGLFELPYNIYKWANRDFVMESFDPEDPPVNQPGLELTFTPEERVPHNENCRICGDD